MNKTKLDNSDFICCANIFQKFGFKFEVKSDPSTEFVFSRLRVFSYLVQITEDRAEKLTGVCHQIPKAL